MNLSKKEIRKLIEKDKLKENILNGSIINCEYCNGTGLKYTKTESNNISWDGSSFCSYCKGAGYWDWIEFITKDQGGK